MMYRQPINQFMASPQASVGGNSPLQTGQDIQRYMEAQKMLQTPQQGVDMFSQFNPGMMGLNMLMNNGMSPQPQNLLQSMPFNSLLSDINPMYKGLSGLFSR